MGLLGGRLARASRRGKTPRLADRAHEHAWAGTSTIGSPSRQLPDVPTAPEHGNIDGRGLERPASDLELAATRRRFKEAQVCPSVGIPVAEFTRRHPADPVRDTRPPGCASPALVHAGSLATLFEDPLGCATVEQEVGHVSYDSGRRTTLDRGDGTARQCRTPGHARATDLPRDPSEQDLLRPLERDGRNQYGSAIHCGRLDASCGAGFVERRHLGGAKRGTSRGRRSNEDHGDRDCGRQGCQPGGLHRSDPHFHARAGFASGSARPGRPGSTGRASSPPAAPILSRASIAPDERQLDTGGLPPFHPCHDSRSHEPRGRQACSPCPATKWANPVPVDHSLLVRVKIDSVPQE